MKARVYLITTPSGRRYVGSAVDYRRRVSTHKYQLRRKAHHNPKLQAAWNKYGEDCILFEEIFCCHKDDVVLFEQKLMDQLKPELNINKFAGSRLGMRHSPKALAKMSASSKGRKATEETRRKLSEIAKAKRHSEEVLSRMRDGHRKLGPDELATYREKMAVIKSNRSADLTMAMIERAKAMGAANRGRVMPPEEIEKRAAAQRRRYERDGGLSEEAKEKLRRKRGPRSKPNRPWTMEEKQKTRERVIRQMADNRVAMLDWILSA